MRVLIVSSLMTLSFSWAVAQEKPVTLTLSRSNKLGASLSDQLKSQDGKISVNGLVVPKKLTSDAQKVFDLVRGFNPPKKKFCGAGTFVLRIDNQGKKSEVKGCAEGKDYGWVVSRLHSLKTKMSALLVPKNK